MKIRKDLRAVLDYAVSLGFRPGFTRKQHLMFKQPGCRTVYCSGTPSDHRVVKNAKAELRRAYQAGDPA